MLLTRLIRSLTRCTAWFAVLGAGYLASGCSSSEFVIANVPAKFRGAQRTVDIPYGEDAREKLDVYSPPRARDRPVIIFWYGGSWSKGSKADYRFVGAELAKLGFIAVLPDYRLYPQVDFPLFDEDGARAVAWVEAHAQEFGGDPRRIILMGHSAGGHTAAFLAFNHEFLRRFGADPADIVGLIGLSGPYALVPDSDELRAAFTAPFTEKDWQPLQFVDAQAPPTLLLHGLADKEVLPKESIELHDALTRVNVPVEMHLYPHRGHADTVAPFAWVVRWRTPVVADVATFVHRVADQDASSKKSVNRE